MNEQRDGIERGIRELTRRRELQAPDFDRLVERPVFRRKAPRRWGWVAASAATAAVLLAVILFRPASVDSDPGWQQVVVDWRAPTDVFLPDLDPPWLSGPPPLGREGLIVYTATRSSDLEIPAMKEESP